MTVIKYTGNGIISKGIHFNKDYNGGLYEVNDELAKYLIETFKIDFVLIEKKGSEKKEPKKRAPRKKKTEDTDEVTE